MIFGLVLALLLHLGAGQQLCTHSAKLDLQIIVDSSRSVGEENFRTMMQGISRSVVGQFEIGADKTRVALFKYGCDGVMKNEISLDSFSDGRSLQLRIESTKFEMGCTKTAMAMGRALYNYQTKVRFGPNIAKVCLVFTDGEADDASEVPAMSRKWAEAGVTVFAIGIGDDISNEGLVAISGDQSRALVADDFNRIGALTKSLMKKVCETIIIPKAPTPPPTQPPAQIRIPVGFARGIDGYYYKFHSERRSWMQAQSTCRAEGGVLAVAWSRLARDAIRAFMPGGGWIGASDQWQEGRWETPLRTTIPFTAWMSGEPNNYGGNEDCVAQLINGLWNDMSCAFPLPFTCQYKIGGFRIILIKKPVVTVHRIPILIRKPVITIHKRPTIVRRPTVTFRIGKKEEEEKKRGRTDFG